MAKKKTTLVSLAAVMALTASLAACSSGNNANNGNGAASSPSGTPAATNSASAGASGSAAAGSEDSGQTAELEPYDVSIVYFGKPEKDVQSVQDKINEYLKDKLPNTTVTLTPIASSEYKQKTELMMNTGEKMDLIFTASWLDYFSNITKGAFLPLDDLLDKYGQGIETGISSPLYLEAPRFKGELYAIPTDKEITQGYAFTYLQSMVDKYNIPIDDINTTAELTPWFEKIKQGEPGMNGKFVVGGEAGQGEAFAYTDSNYSVIGPTPGKLQTFFVDINNTDNIQVKTVIDPEIAAMSKEEYDVAREQYEKGYSNADALTATNQQLTDIRKQGKLFWQGTTWKPGADIEMKTGTGYDWVSHVVQQPIVTTDLATGSMMSISRTSKNPERAMMVLNLLHTDKDLINLIVFGIEGKHYTKTGENRIEQIKDSGYGEAALFWVLGNQLLDYLLPGQADDLYDQFRQFNKDVTRSPLLGFTFDDSNVKNELAQLTSVATEYKALGTGAVNNPDKLLAERNEKFKNAGIDKVRDELQKQIDAWLSSNQK